MIKNKLFYVYLTLFLPLTIAVPMRMIAGSESLPYISTGTIIFTVTMNALTTANQDIAVDRTLKRITILITKPISSTVYFLGLLLSNGLQTMPATFMVVVVLYFITTFYIKNAPLFIFSLLMGWYISVLLGFLIGVSVSTKNYRQAILLGNIVSFILSFLAPVYYPLRFIPKPLRWVSLALYTTHVANLIGSSTEVKTIIDPFFSLLFLIILAILLTIILSHKIKLRDFY